MNTVKGRSSPKSSVSAKGKVLVVPIGGGFASASTARKATAVASLTKQKKTIQPKYAAKAALTKKRSGKPVTLESPSVAVLSKPAKHFVRQKKITADSAREFLTKAGILDTKGNLKTIFR